MFADDAAFEDCWKICNLDYNLPFSSLEDVVGRLLPFHVRSPPLSLVYLKASRL